MDEAFQPDRDGLFRALELLLESPSDAGVRPGDLPDDLPEIGAGERAALETLAPRVLGGAARLGGPTALAHMDPPTPWIAWAMALWNASLNQNLLHPALSPFAAEAERRVIAWLAPLFGMTGGHMTGGSSLANLTGLWAAREIAGIRRVVGSEASHLSIPKAATILGLAWEPIAADASGRIDRGALSDLTDAALVLTAGTTGVGAIDSLDLAGKAAWTHADAAWAGPLRFSDRHAPLLDGIERADSVAVSAHKWMFQPKEAALILFRETDAAHAAISSGGAYLVGPNVGVQGSRGAAAIPLLATVLAWGREGLAARIDSTMALADDLHARLATDPRAETLGPPQTGVLLWRPRPPTTVAEVAARLPGTAVSKTSVAGRDWLRHVAANPEADVAAIWNLIDRALSS